jgi:hypothetical protein
MAQRGTIAALISAVPIIILAAIGVYFWREHTEKDRVIAEQKRIIRDLGDKLDRSWAEELVADVRVNALRTDVANKPIMDLTFVEYQHGTEVPTMKRDFTLPGEEFYIDALVVKFDRKLVEAGDGLRGKSILLFRRAFGDAQKPTDGVLLYTREDASPVPERVKVDAQPSAFERELWSSFWAMANDPDVAKAKGVRVAQGEAPHIRAQAGQVYKITLRASGGLEIVPRLPAAVVGATQGSKPTPAPAAVSP